VRGLPVAVAARLVIGVRGCFAGTSRTIRRLLPDSGGGALPASPPWGPKRPSAGSFPIQGAALYLRARHGARKGPNHRVSLESKERNFLSLSFADG
jgi:hypothetical protein